MMSSSLNGTAQGHPHLSSPPPSTTVTNYTFEYLVELNNLTDESCLVVISEKVYDLTLWLQDQLSPPSLPSQSFPLSPSASPPPSPSSISSERLASLGASPTGKNTWHQVGSTTDWDRTSPPPPEASDPFVPLDPIDGLHRVLYLSKSDPIRAGETIREIFESEQRNRIESFRNQPSLDEWIQDFRIGDYARPSAPNPSCNQHQSMRTSLVPALDSSRRFSKKRQNPRESQHNCCGPELHVAHQQPDLGSCQGTSKQPAQSSSNETFRQFPDFDNHSNEAGTGEPHASTSLNPNHQARLCADDHQKLNGPSHLLRAMNEVDRLKSVVRDAQLGVGQANNCLNDAWSQLAKAEKVRDDLVMQACEGIRPIWHEWGPE